MSKKILIGLMTLVLAIGLIGAGAFAVFNDTETSSGNTFTAGTLNLKVGSADPCTAHITIPNIKPGGLNQIWRYWIYNTGTLDGKLTIEIGTITNNDNGCNEPECLAEGGSWDGTSCTGDCGAGEGELGEYLTIDAQWVKGDNPIGSGRVFQNTWMPGVGPLNYWGGKTSSIWDLKAKSGNQIQFRFTLPAAGNIVQSDSVEFDVIFHLVQAP